MQKSESITNIAKSFAQFQAEITNPHNTADNPFFKSKYAPLSDILNLVRPSLSKHGLSVLQSTSGTGADISVTTLLMHSSGEWIESEPLTLKADKITAQGAGSAVTYARRYALSAVLGISSEDDDDGNHASQSKIKNTGEKTKEIPNDNDVISEAQAKRIFAMSKGDTEKVKKVCGKYGYKSSKEILKSDYEMICKEIES